MGCIFLVKIYDIRYLTNLKKRLNFIIMNYLLFIYAYLENRTNNRLESTNQKITQVVTTFCILDQLFEGKFHLTKDY